MAVAFLVVAFLVVAFLVVAFLVVAFLVVAFCPSIFGSERVGRRGSTVGSRSSYFCPSTFGRTCLPLTASSSCTSPMGIFISRETERPRGSQLHLRISLPQCSHTRILIPPITMESIGSGSNTITTSHMQKPCFAALQQYLSASAGLALMAMSKPLNNSRLTVSSRILN